MRITRRQLRRIIQEETEEAFDIGDVLRTTRSDDERLDLLDKMTQYADESDRNYFIDTWGVMSPENARQRYNDYVLSQGEYENDGLLDPMNQSLMPDFIKWMHKHPKVFEKELATQNPAETVVDYAARMSARKSSSGSDSDPDTNDDGMLSVGELEKMTQDIAADVRESAMKITRRQLRQMIRESTYHMAKHDDDSNKIMAMTSVVMRGIQVSLGKELSEEEEYEYRQEVRRALENNMPVLNMLYDIFFEIKTGGGFQGDHYDTYDDSAGMSDEMAGAVQDAILELFVLHGEVRTTDVFDHLRQMGFDDMDIDGGLTALGGMY